MSLRQQLGQSLNQELLLLPRMLQAVQILQLPALELEAWLREAAQENEALELEERAEPLEHAPRRRARGTQASLDHDQWLQSQPARAASLPERLEEQLAMLELDPRTLAWARFVIGRLDQRGFLASTDGELISAAQADGLDGDEEELAQALSVVRGLEPRGIGARSAVEALLLQLDPREPHYVELRRLLEQFLDEIARNKLPSVAHAMGLSLAELGDLLARLSQLDPCPASQLDDSSAPALRPDLVVERDGEDFAVRVEAAGLPAARVDEHVAGLARDRSQPRELRGYLRTKLERARWIVDGLEQRSRTLQRVATGVFAHQRAFLVDGPRHLTALAMRELADELGLHVSTVSRAVSGKYVDTPWGMFLLRHFFQSAAGDPHTARDEVREIVRDIFAREDPHQPLSDDAVVADLKQRGLELARRTVAKYRGELGIASSYRRRKFDAS